MSMFPAPISRRDLDMLLMARRRQGDLEREQYAKDALAQEGIAERQARRAYAPQLGAWSQRVVRFRAANPGQPLSNDLRDQRDELLRDRASAATGGLPEGLRRMRAENTGLEAQGRLTDAEASAQPVLAEAAMTQARGKLLEGYGASQAPRYGFMGEREKASAARDVATTGLNSQREVNRTNLRLGRMEGMSRQNVAQIQTQGQLSAAELEAGSRRYSADREFDLGMAQTQAKSDMMQTASEPGVFSKAYNWATGGAQGVPSGLQRPSPQGAILPPIESRVPGQTIFEKDGQPYLWTGEGWQPIGAQ